METDRKSSRNDTIGRESAETGLSGREIRSLHAENTAPESSRVAAIQGRTDDISPDVLLAEFPGWHLFTGVNRLAYGRRLMTSPPALVRGEDWTDVRDQIRVWERSHSRF